MAKSIGGLLGGLLGGEIAKPKKPPEAQKTQLDPDRGAQIAEARRRKFAQAQAAGRSNFRIDLGTGGGGSSAGQVRGGIQIQ